MNRCLRLRDVEAGGVHIDDAESDEKSPSKRQAQNAFSSQGEPCLWCLEAKWFMAIQAI